MVPWLVMVDASTGTEPISINILMSVSRSEGGDCLYIMHPTPSAQVVGLNKSGEGIVVLPKVF